MQINKQTRRLSEASFWNIKHQIDDEVARLGWSKLYCKQYIICNYGCKSRLYMTDAALLKLLAEVKSIPTPKRTQNLLKTRSKDLGD